MRLDKYLKISLIFKTRSSADKLITAGKILVNDKPSKSATNIKPDDIIIINNIFKTTTYKVLELHENNVSRDIAKTMYEIIKEESHEF